MKELWLVSACLLGKNCTYNGENNYNQKVIEFLKDKCYIAVCPEEAGGLGTPRIPCERNGNKVINRENHFSLSLPATLSANKEKASESVDQTRQWSIKASPSVKLSVAFIITINSQTITITMLKLLIRLFFCLSIFLFPISGAHGNF